MMEEGGPVKLGDLNSWKDYSDVTDQFESDNLSNSQSQIGFSVSENLNKKLYLWKGNAACLEVDCLILPINEVLLKETPFAIKICEAAGPGFENNLDDIIESGDIRTGTVCIGDSYNMACKSLIHVMEPRITDKFLTGVETAVHNCNRSAIQIATEQSHRKIAITPLYKTADKEIEMQMVNATLRTVRCCMCNLTTKLEAVILVVGDDQWELYTMLLPAYFPRSAQEAIRSFNLLPDCQVGKWGEVLYPDREIRITDLASAKDNDADASTSDSNSDTSDESIVPGNMNELSFTKMSGDHDEKRRHQLRMLTNDQMLRAQERIYRRLLRLARTNDLSPIAATNALYLSGEDHTGSPVVVLIAKYMNVPNLDLDQALLYFIHILDSIVDDKYSIVYFHSQSQKHNRVPQKFVRKAYDILDQRYKTNLKYLYIVHPTFWSKVFTLMFTTFSTNAIKGKIMFIKNIPQIYQFISADQIDIPPFILDHDMQTNPSIYPGMRNRSRTQRQPTVRRTYVNPYAVS